MGFKITNIKRNVNTLKFLGKKHSPLILTVTGMAGLATTGVLSYKAAKKVVDITEDIEAMRENGDDVDRKYQLIRVGKAVLPPLLIGSASLVAIFGSYHVLNKRNGVLATALSYVTAENKRIKARLKSEDLLHLAAPVNTVETEEEILDEDGNKVTVIDRVDIPQLDSVWYDNESEYYVSDDHSYNQMSIQAAERRINERQCESNVITLNELLNELGFQPKKVGTTFGWFSHELITLEQTVMQERTEDGDLRPIILITWPEPHYIYDAIDYSRLKL